MPTITIFDPLEEASSFQYKEAKKAGYTDEEIIAFLSAEESPSKDAFDYVEVLGKKADHFRKDYPISFWSIIVVIIVLLALGAIKCIWKLITFVLYQTVYTIAQAIKDVSRE